ncbi:HAMP domain-containing sensor histidine kinase [Methylosinus sp. C49]|uniref:sensor histidine kinase n=1 Tax=Methylosinus sp. C49 TaxID=2699395 RepID=UPI00137987DC|nr:HAMP domain-containing sensor histidine kinase [Methylosinus sp. C49]
MQSLTTRLIVYLLFAQLVGAFLPWPVVAYLASVAERYGGADAMLEIYTYFHIQDLVAESLETSPEGAVRLAPTERLKLRADQDEDVRYAAMAARSTELAPGSSPELHSKLVAAKEADARVFRFHTEKGPDAGKWGVVTLMQTRSGPVYIAASGFRFHWLDVVHFVIRDKFYETVAFLVGWLASCSIVFLGLRQALGSLRRAAKAAERIDLDSMGQGIVATGVPTEIRPIIAAMNGALARLDGSVARMRRFTANTAHELRTPLAVMRARLENEEPSPLKNDLLRDASRLHATVEQLLIAARISENQVTIDEDVDLSETVCQIVADHSPLARRSERGIAVEGEERATIVRGNRRAIESVVANLIGNALKAEPPGGTVLVRLRPEGEVEVIDHGEGVAPGHRETIFEPFWRKSEATPGSGLGLAIAKELITKLRGRICVEETPGGGATFKLSFQPGE